ncbi:MAG TPA: hypothetical protein VML96_03130, partial [Egibacteraceae bacterium]|nr:hypothetical protein [Egibacteraceae bacterium]
GWHVTPLPGGAEVLTTGYITRIGDVGGDPWFEVFPDDLVPASPGVWDSEQRRALWLARRHPGRALISVDADGQFESVELDWAGDRQELDGLAQQASGRLVTIRSEVDEQWNPIDGSSTGIVFEPTGAIAATFPVEPGSSLGGYDPSGRFLIYVAGDGAVRWQGPGGGGELGQGYLFASW